MAGKYPLYASDALSRRHRAESARAGRAHAMDGGDDEAIDREADRQNSHEDVHGEHSLRRDNGHRASAIGQREGRRVAALERKHRQEQRLHTLVGQVALDDGLRRTLVHGSGDAPESVKKTTKTTVRLTMSTP